MEHTKKSWYRPDIDGLRALAIIPVVLFHADVVGFSGGFIGVDIFFVISGFLITSIIYREIKEERFSLITFWERRARRIIPAMFVVVMSTLVAGYFIVLFPIDFIDLGQSAFAQALFLANIFFMRNGNYFAGPSESMPLLHTWSLSVEEQFYIGFPLVMLLIWRYAHRALLPILLFAGIASLCYAQYLLSVNPADGFSIPFVPNVWSGALNMSAAFYFLPTRAFELLIGALVAITAYSITRRSIAETVSLLGLGMIVYAIIFFDSDTVFPGLAALVPTLGTACIIVANASEKTFVGSLLSFPVFIWIGLISYSLYLWHWPVIVLTKIYMNVTTLDTTTIVFVITTSFLLSYFTYRFVETPFRVKTLLPGRTSMLVGGAIALLITAFAGIFIAEQKGLPNRAPGEALAIAAATVDFGERRGECFVNAFSTSDEPCYIGLEDANNIDFVIWGDSHAASLLPMLEDEAKLHNLTGATFIIPGCIPISNTDTVPSIKKCQDVKELARTFIIEHDIQHVILISRWNSYDQLRLMDDNQKTEEMDLVVYNYIFDTAFTDMAAEFARENVTLYVVKQVPQHLDFNARILFYDTVKNPDRDTITGVSYDRFLNDRPFIHTYFDKPDLPSNVHVLDPATILCPGREKCLLMQDGVLLYENADHINKTGSFLLAPLFSELFVNW